MSVAKSSVPPLIFPYWRDKDFIYCGYPRHSRLDRLTFSSTHDCPGKKSLSKAHAKKAHTKKAKKFWQPDEVW